MFGNLQEPIGHPSRWATRVRSGAAAPAAPDFGAIADHLARCLASRGRWSTLLRAGDALSRFVAPRVVTTVMAALAVWAVVVALS